MKRILKGVLYLGSLWLLLPGCMDDFEPSLIEEPRILALRAEVITDGDDAEAYRLEALAHDVSDLQWRVCTSPWVPTESGVECTSQAYPLPSTDDPSVLEFNLADYPIPEEYRAYITSLYFLAESGQGDVPPAVLALDINEGPNNPPLEGVSVNGDTAEAWAADGTEAQSIEIQPTWGDDDATEEVTTAFFTTSGAFEPWRVVGSGPSTLALEELEEPVTIYVISRFLGEGTSWRRLELQP